MSKVNALIAALKDKERKPLYKIAMEVAQSSLIEKELSSYYFSSYLYKKGTPDFRNYVSNQKLTNIYYNWFLSQDQDLIDQLENKVLFGRILSDNKVNTPEVLAYNDKNILYVKNDAMKIRNAQEFVGALHVMFESFSGKSLFVKPLDGMGGSSSFKLNRNSLDTKQIEQLYSMLETTNFIFQPTVQQHEDIMKIYDKSINTIRVHTYRDKFNNIKVISAFMRFGAGGNYVDNGKAGGLYVPVDINKWVLGETGYSDFKKVGKTYKKHPDTGVVFKGYEIPEPEQIVTEVVKAAELFDIDFVGWDVSVTDTGATIIEGNHNPDLIMAQTACGGLRSHPEYKKIFAEYF